MYARHSRFICSLPLSLPGEAGQRYLSLDFPGASGGQCRSFLKSRTILKKDQSKGISETITCSTHVRCTPLYIRVRIAVKPPRQPKQTQPPFALPSPQNRQSARSRALLRHLNVAGE